MSYGKGLHMRGSHLATSFLHVFLGVSILCGVAANGEGRPVPEADDAVRATVQVGEDGRVLVPSSGPARRVIYAEPVGQGGNKTNSLRQQASGFQIGQSLNIAIVASASGDVGDPFFTDPQERLLASGFFDSVTAINAGIITPSVAELDAFDAVLVWSNFDFADADALGDNLVDYVDGGGGVVVAVFANSASTADRYLRGRWLTQDYAIIPTQSGTATGPAALGTIKMAGHPLMKGVNVFFGGTNGFRPDVPTSALLGNSVVVAEWDDGDPRVLVALRDDMAGRRVDLGFNPVSDDVLPGYWDQTTDGGLLLANAMQYAAERTFSAPVAFDIGSRYLAITPPDVADPVALLVTGDATNPSVSCLSAYVQSDATLGPAPVFQTSDEWGVGALQVAGSEIVPDTEYGVQADHGSPGAPLLSGASTLTTWRWGDANNDGIVDLSDILCVLDGFEGRFVNCSRYAVDLLPNQPEFLIDLSDILAMLDAFQGAPYPGPLPCE